METFDFRGWPIRYVKMGSGEPVVFLHNGGTSHAIWRDVLPRIAERHEVFALDLLGYGASAKPGTGYSLDDYEAMLADFVESEIGKRVALVGNCMGSAISMKFAMSREESVRALVLINPLTEATFSAGWLGATLRMRRRAPALTGRVYGQLARMRMPGWLSSTTLSFQLGSDGRARKVQANDDLCACASSSGQMRSLLAVLDDMESYGFLDGFSPGEAFPKVTTIWGLENRVLSPEAGRKLNAKLSPAREEWLEGCGHLPMLEKPEVVARIIEEALEASQHREPLHRAEEHGA